MTRRVALVAAFLLAAPIACGKSRQSGAPPMRAAGAAPEAPSGSAAQGSLEPNSDEVKLEAAESWRQELGRTSPRQIAALPGGGYAVALSFSATVAIEAPDSSLKHSSAGEDDILVVGVSEAGAVQWVTRIGGAGDEEVKDLIASKNGIHLAVRTDEPLTVAGRTVAPRAPRSGDALDYPHITALVRLSGAGQPLAVEALPNEPREVVMGALESGDLIMAASFTGKDELFGHAEVRRVSPHGEVHWTQHIPAIEVHKVFAWQERLVLSVRANARLGLWTLDPATGGVIHKYEIEKPLGTGDLGTIAGAVSDSKGELVGFGETGDDVMVDGHRIARPSYAIQPFALRAGGNQAVQFIEGPVLTARVVGVGLVRTRPAAVLDVIHTGVDPHLHRGVYVGLLGAAGVELVPVFQQRFRNDDWEHAPAETVLGNPLSAYAAVIAGDSAAVLGRCEPNAKTTCLTRIELRPAR
ncbi:MAG: hypothetical protein IPM54_24380 [Polyangiaceae bacterium]|nr:hypothetical protein [Polyangiaceae bacterium]